MLPSVLAPFLSLSVSRSEKKHANRRAKFTTLSTNVQHLKLDYMESNICSKVIDTLILSWTFDSKLESPGHDGILSTIVYWLILVFFFIARARFSTTHPFFPTPFSTFFYFLLLLY